MALEAGVFYPAGGVKLAPVWSSVAPPFSPLTILRLTLSSCFSYALAVLLPWPSPPSALCPLLSLFDGAGNLTLARLSKRWDAFAPSLGLPSSVKKDISVEESRERKTKSEEKRD